MKRKLWFDCDGGVITTELVLVASFVTAMLIGGLGTLKQRINSEFVELADVVETARGESTIPTVEVAQQDQFGIEIAGDGEAFLLP